MKCENCKKNEANVFLRQSVNGNTMEVSICSECAEKLGIAAKMKMPQFGFNSFFNDFDDDFAFGFENMFKRMTDNLRAFSNYNAPQFVLHIPEIKSDKDESLGKYIPKKNEEKKEIKNELQVLKMQLKDAVAKEEYEKAAVLRDKINKISKDSKESK